MKDPFKDLPDELRKKLKKKRQASWTAPMLATLTDDIFSDEEWIFEKKLDGERVLTFRRGKMMRLMSRNQKRINDSYPELAEALGKQSVDDFIVDGEVVAFKGNITSFSRLQARMKLSDPEKARRSGVVVYYYLFDLLHANGHGMASCATRDSKGCGAISQRRKLYASKTECFNRRGRGGFRRGRGGKLSAFLCKNLCDLCG